MCGMFYDNVQTWTQGKAAKANVAFRTAGMETVEAQMRLYGQRLTKAKRFHLDNNFVATALELSRDLDRLQYWVNLARLPYEDVWIEFDPRFKVQESWNQGHYHHPDWHNPEPPDLDQVSPEMGILFHQTNADSGAWDATIFGIVTGGALSHGQVTPTPVQWICAPEGSALLPVQHKRLIQKLFPIFTQDTANVGIGATMEGLGDQYIILDWVANRIACALEPTWYAGMQEHLATVPEFPTSKAVRNAIEQVEASVKFVDDTLTDHLLYVLHEDRGIMRFIIAVLALMSNAAEVRQVVVPAAGHRGLPGKRLPYLGHSTITLDLPRRKPIRVFAKELDVASALRRHNRAHTVRGHFRMVEHGKGGFRCDHVPTMVENGLGICLRCERLIRWIPNHVRGDAELGWVTHDYEVTST